MPSKRPWRKPMRDDKSTQTMLVGFVPTWQR